MTEAFRVLEGDAVEWIEALDDASVDVVLMDPPFSSGTRREGAKGVRKSMVREVDDAEWFLSDSLTVAGFTHLLRRVALGLHRIVKPGGHILSFIDWRMAPHAGAAIESVDLRHVGQIVWDKDRLGMGSSFRNQHEIIQHFTRGMGRPPLRRDVGDVIRCAPVRNGAHPTEKPVALLQRLLGVVARPGDVVLDPFAGSGSTGVAALAEGMTAILIEREPRYAAVARVRCEDAGRQRVMFGSTHGEPIGLDFDQ